ncbi:YugN-like family protein [Paenibacillus sp. CC-CFT747]|nr:YugN-like family protein [Paenibacillus sp. CC-CFT747]
MTDHDYLDFSSREQASGLCQYSKLPGRLRLHHRGNWEYDHGYFDANLDEAQKIWVRIPFTVIHGTFDGDTKESDAVIRLGKPFALKHLYEEGLDNEARPMVSAALVNQFQDPVDKDAEIEQKWLDEAENLLKRVEQGFPLNRRKRTSK